MPRQQIRFCTAPDGVRIAYAISGEGPPLLKAANWLNHLEYDLESPVWRRWLEEVSRHHTLIRYDERGCGLSDWDVEDLSFEAWIRDLETVARATGLERFPLLGSSQGAPIAIAYAVRHPERVTRLVLHGSYARGVLKRNPTPEKRAEVEAMTGFAAKHAGDEAKKKARSSGRPFSVTLTIDRRSISAGDAKVRGVSIPAFLSR